jgi:hypothetical protein
MFASVNMKNLILIKGRRLKIFGEKTRKNFLEGEKERFAEEINKSIFLLRCFFWKSFFVQKRK